MIDEIKAIVQNYLNNAKLCSFINGIVVDSGIKISDKLTIPMVLIVGNLKDKVVVGDKVILLRNYGGQQFFILEVLNDTK